jgi:hypothetical protein
MHLVMLAAAPLVAFAAVMGVAIGWDRLREPRRALHRPFAVVDAHTYRDARRRIDRLAAIGDWPAAWAGTIAICQWLNHEQHYGRQSRRTRLAAELATWTARREEYNPLVSLSEPDPTS